MRECDRGVGRRTSVKQNGRFYVETRILCHAQKVACDKLANDYQELDRRMNQAMAADKSGK